MTPYGYGGPLVLEPGGDVAGAYDAWCRERGVLSTFAVFHPLLPVEHGAASA